jgi:hypothetical protein
MAAWRKSRILLSQRTWKALYERDIYVPLVTKGLSSVQVFQHLTRLCTLLCTWCHRLSNIFVVVLVVLVINTCNVIALQTLAVRSRKFNSIHCFNDQFSSTTIYLIINEEKFYLDINESVGPIEIYLLHFRVYNK